MNVFACQGCGYDPRGCRCDRFANPRVPDNIIPMILQLVDKGLTHPMVVDAIRVQTGYVVSKAQVSQVARAAGKRRHRPYTFVTRDKVKLADIRQFFERDGGFGEWRVRGGKERIAERFRTTVTTINRLLQSWGYVAASTKRGPAGPHKGAAGLYSDDDERLSYHLPSSGRAPYGYGPVAPFGPTAPPRRQVHASERQEDFYWSTTKNLMAHARPAYELRRASSVLDTFPKLYRLCQTYKISLKDMQAIVEFLFDPESRFVTYTTLAKSYGIPNIAVTEITRVVGIKSRGKGHLYKPAQEN